MTGDGLLLDTDVLVDFLRSRPEAVTFVRANTANVWISAVTVAELFAGVRDGRERFELMRFLSDHDDVIVPVDTEIAVRGGLFRRDYGRSHGTSLSDALIAGTADVRRLQLVSLNARHFPMLGDVLVPYRKTS